LIRLALALTALSLLLSGTSEARTEKMAVVKACPGHVHGVYFYRKTARYWETKLGREPSKSNFNASHVLSCKYVVWVAHLWQKRAVETRSEFAKHQAEIRRLQRAQNALTSDWACIHRYEGAWNSNTGNGYYGGLQMDWNFMSHYGSEFLARWGTADNWPVWAQVSAANRAKNSGRGYYPWPNTARACGLI
jgi:hypothetical protein